MLHSRDFALGNIFSEDMESILNGHARNQHLTASVTGFSDCDACDIQYLCGGGCRARAYYSTGTINSKDPYCSMIKEFYKGFAVSLRAAKR
jgi:radical SAM protein with 4Fe4S-binding SPASM domain